MALSKRSCSTKTDRPEAKGGKASSLTKNLPESSLLERIGSALDRHGQVGLLTITLLETRPGSRAEDWELYEEMAAAVGRFLTETKQAVLRREDQVFELMVKGNAFVLLIAPPRDGRPLGTEQMYRVRVRMNERLRELFRRTPAWNQQERFGCFLGCAILEGPASGLVDRRIWAALDRALADALRAKELTASSHSDAVREVIEQGKLRAVYQPIVDLSQRKVLGYEALSRPETRLIRRPDQLMKTASDHGLLWPVERLCRKRIIEGIAGRFPKDRFLFINVEPDSLHDPEFCDNRILQTFEEAGVGPDHVVLEITEHAGIRDFAALGRTLIVFRSLGFKLAIDDMGAGFSGLKTLTEINPEFIKVDLSLVRGIHLSRIKQEMMSMILRYSKNTGSVLISEGVETIEELRALRSIGIRYAQGYFFAYPGEFLPEPDLSCLD